MTTVLNKVGTCSRCKQDIFSPPESMSAGYATNKDNDRICYRCCGIMDKEIMRTEGKITLYLTCEPASNEKNPAGRRTLGKVSNWCGTLEFVCHTSTGKHNIARVRYDCWFPFEGYWWHGVTYGDDTQVCHCRRTKDVVQYVRTRDPDPSIPKS